MTRIAVACPGCREKLRMPDITKKRTGSYLHNCRVLGPMPDPADAPALMEWAAGALKQPRSTSTVKPVITPAPEQKRIHVPFDDTRCTKDGCRTHGKVPGVRRHIGFMHPDEAAELSAKLPPNRTIDGLVANFEKDPAGAHALLASLNLQEKYPQQDESWSWEEAAVSVLNAVEDEK